MEIDIRTITILTSIILIGPTLSLYAFWKSKTRSIGLGYWIGGMIACSLASLLIGLRDITSMFLSVFVANILFVVGNLLFLRGVWFFIGRSVLPVFEVVVTFLVGSSFWYFTYVNFNVSARVVIISSILSLISVFTAYELVKGRRNSWSRAGLTAAVIFLINGLYLGIRVLITLQMEPIPRFLEAGNTQAVVFLELIFFYTGVTFTFIWMTYSSLEGERQVLLSAVKQSPSAIIITNSEGAIEYVNPAFTEKNGYTYDEVVGENPGFLKSGELDNKVYDELWETINNGDTWRGELHNKTKTGDTYWEMASIGPVKLRGDKISHFVAVKEDITQRKNMEEQLRHMATHDSLTGLPTRRLSMDLLDKAMMMARRQNNMVAVMFADLDGFKFVNDSFGHDTGDKLLVEVGERLTGCVREVDTVARVGGDEFIIIITDVDSDADVATVAEKIIDSVSSPFTMDYRDIVVGISIGVSVYPVHGKLASDLVRFADCAMYCAKKRGRNNYEFFREKRDNCPFSDLESSGQS